MTDEIIDGHICINTEGNCTLRSYHSLVCSSCRGNTKDNITSLNITYLKSHENQIYEAIKLFNTKRINV